MTSMNKAILIGRLGRDPDSRTTQSGKPMVSFSLATGSGWTDKVTGERRSNTEWHQIVIFGERTAAYAESYLRKGDLVSVEGEIKSRKWTDRDGKDRQTTEIVVGFTGDVRKLAGSGAAGSSEDDGERRQSAPAPRTQQSSMFGGGQAAPARGGQAGGWDAGGDLNDDIPF